MRFIIGKHYKDTKMRDGEDAYVASAIDVDAGNLVNVRDGSVYFADDAPVYSYADENGNAVLVFDNTPMMQAPEDPERFCMCEIVVEIVA